jgi:hypothetical protein
MKNLLTELGFKEVTEAENLFIFEKNKDIMCVYYERAEPKCRIFNHLYDDHYYGDINKEKIQQIIDLLNG